MSARQQAKQDHDIGETSQTTLILNKSGSIIKMLIGD